MRNTVRGPAPQAFRRSSGPAPVVRARHFASDSKVRRLEYPLPRPHLVANHIETPRPRPKPGGFARRTGVLREVVAGNLLLISAGLFMLGAAGWCWVIYNQFRAPVLSAPPEAAYTMSVTGDAGVGKSDSFGTSSHARADRQQIALPDQSFGNESPASVVAREWGRFETFKTADRVRTTVKPAKVAAVKAPVRLASLEGGAVPLSALRPPTQAVPSRIRPEVGAVTSLVDFETAPFPYRGAVADSSRSFLNAGQDGHRGHVNFRGHVYWESPTFSDDRVLLHIPPGFDPSRPAVMVVFFHGHGATLARDVRDRQQVPAQITAAGANAVLVAPQFAVDAADSSAGKFWEPNGFKRFLDEAAVKLARLYGDPRRVDTFANMPIVLVAYSGGFGPTLSVLDRGGVRSRIRGVVLLDALYAGIDKFANWIADNRSTFFVSSYTPHTAHHNTDLERLLAQHAISYQADLRSRQLQGMVAFLPTGDVSHRNFVNHAWADYPIKDILTRMDTIDQRIETAGAAPSSTGAFAAARN